MHAFEIPGMRFSLPAGEDITRRRFVNVNASSLAVIATAGGAVLGVAADDAASGAPVTIADGIVMVEAGGIIAAGSQIEVGASGKAIVKSTGVGVGVAITGAAADGQIMAVKLVSVSAANGADGAATQTILYTAADLDAGADLAATPIGVVAGAGTITKVSVVSLGAAAGVDADNTSVFALKVGATAKAGITFDAETAFPASGAADEATIADADVADGDVLSLSVTNGATANLPAFMVQVAITLD